MSTKLNDLKKRREKLQDMASRCHYQGKRRQSDRALEELHRVIAQIKAEEKRLGAKQAI